MDDENTSAQTMKMMSSDLDAAYTELERTTENYLSHFDSEDEEIERSNIALEESYRERCRILIQISKKPSPVANKVDNRFRSPTHHRPEYT